MHTLDLARQLATDRRRALRPPSRHAPTGRTRPRPRPIRRFLEWLDRVVPATEIAPC